MSLLQEVFKEIKKMDTPKLSDHNLVAKHSRSSGAGAHKDKNGKHAARHRQKHQWRKEAL